MRLFIISMFVVACGTSYDVQDQDASTSDDAASFSPSPPPTFEIPHCLNQEVCRIVTHPNGVSHDFCCGLPMWYTVTGARCSDQACTTGQPCYLPVVGDSGALPRQGTCL